MISSFQDIQVNTPKQLPISLAYAPSATDSDYLEIEAVEGTTLLQALQQAGWLQKYPLLKQWCDEHAEAEQINNKSW